MTTPTLSVIVPAKDQELYLADALTSLTKQSISGRDLEVIVVDDGSGDRTSEIAMGFHAQLPGLHIVRHETPRGLAEARNAGLRHAHGKYIAFLDADDWYAPGFLSRACAAMESLQVDMLRCDHATVTEGRRHIVRAPYGIRNRSFTPSLGILPFHHSTLVDYPYAWAGMFHRSLLDQGLLEFPCAVHTAEDRPWIWQLHLRATSCAVISDIGVLYRRGVSTSLTQIIDDRQLDFGRAFACARQIVGEWGTPEHETKLAVQFLAVSAHHMTRCSEIAPERLPAFENVITSTARLFTPERLALAQSYLDEDRHELLVELMTPLEVV